MSGYISSLLIEPVVRQARRLSLQSGRRSHSDNDVHDLRQGTQSDVCATANADKNGIIVLGHKGPDGRGLEMYHDRQDCLEPSALSDTVCDTEAAAVAVADRPEPCISRNPPARSLTYDLASRDEVDSSNAPVEPGTVRFEHTDETLAASESAQRHAPRLQSAFEVDNLEALVIPEDDGMGTLRRKIHAVRDSRRLSNTEKARIMHELMTESYNKTRGILGSAPHPSSLSPLSPPATDGPASPTSRWSGQSLANLPMTPSSVASLIQTSITWRPQSFDVYDLTEEDLKPTFCPLVEPEPTPQDDDDLETEDSAEPQLGCRHYKRNVKLQCFTCKKWYTCRFCHDEKEDHHLIRHKTEHMLCMLCGHGQPAAQWCRKCGEPAAQYYCNVCKLWDNDGNKSIYHCEDCGICRIGQGLGKDFFHCKTCSVCLPISIETTHRCIERSTQCDCPICGDYMFTSPETVVVMRCGHSIHHKCLAEYSKNSYRCPICSKTITNMETTFRNLDRTIKSQPMPAEFKDTTAMIYCNDCSAKSVVRYHWLGLKCDVCESYNTAQLQLLHDDLAEFVGDDTDGITRPRSASYSIDANALANDPSSLDISTSSMPGPNHMAHLSMPSSAGPVRQDSYSITRARAVSPVVSNYFGLPSARSPSPSTSPSRDQEPNSPENNRGDEFRFWGRTIRYRVGFLSGEGETESDDGESQADGSIDEEVVSGEEEGNEDESDDGEGDDEVERIDIFGHR